jgi:hypothetical protein
MEHNPITHAHNGIILAVTTFGAIMAKLTGSNIATGLTILLGIVGLVSYFYTFVLNKKKNHNYDLEKKKLLLEIQELEQRKKRKTV